MEDRIFFNQSKYIKEMLKKFGLEDSKPTKTPMSTKTKLTKDYKADSVDSSKYRGMIGSLLYLTTSRPDIMFSICLCARFQENPKTTHLEAVKRIFRYIRETSHLGLWYLKATGIETIVYADSNHAGDYVDRKSTSGVCTFMICCLTSWFAKKQTTLAISTTEVEYVSAGKACQQALWMKQALIDYGIRLDDVSIMCDNKGAIDLSKKPVQHSRTKHIEIRHHILRDNIQKGNIFIENVASEDNIADIFTKPLKREEGGARGVAEEAQAAPGGGDADEEMPQAVPPPPKTQGERIARLEEEVHDMRKVLQGQREVLDSMARNFSKFSTWTITSLARLMDKAGVPYTRYSESPVEYQRRTRQRNDEPSTSTSPQQPDP
ncbi:hypothetical protein Tco_0296750 [Tanacetum coccineum]